MSQKLELQVKALERRVSDLERLVTHPAEEGPLKTVHAGFGKYVVADPRYGEMTKEQAEALSGTG